MFVIHLNDQNLKPLKLQILVIKCFFFIENLVVYIFSLYLWAKYEPI